MSEERYEVKREHGNIVIYCDGRWVMALTEQDFNVFIMERFIEVLNSESAPLHARIAELEAGIQKASNDLYNYHFEPRLNISLHRVSMDLEQALKKAGDHD